MKKTIILIMAACMLLPLLSSCTNHLRRYNDTIPVLEEDKLADVKPTAEATPIPTPTPTPAPIENGIEATFLGILGYGTISIDEVTAEGSAVYRFEINGTEFCYAVTTENSYEIQNMLIEGNRYILEVDDGVHVTRVTALDNDVQYVPAYSGTAGENTLRNLLLTALEPVGTALYVYGGGWNWQDNGGCSYSRSTKIPMTWRNFFNTQDASYRYKNGLEPESCTYPFGKWNEYWYAGLDCSGYIGRTIYKTFYSYDNATDENGNAVDFVCTSTDMAAELAEMGMGTLSSSIESLVPGSIVSINGHVWLYVGSCSDGSAVILHSTPTVSRNGGEGGGVQFSAINPTGDTECEALTLIQKYTSTYYPDWYERYEVKTVSWDTYTDISKGGVLIWDEGVLTDEEGLRSLSAPEILSILFVKENTEATEETTDVVVEDTTVDGEDAEAIDDSENNE